MAGETKKKTAKTKIEKLEHGREYRVKVKVATNRLKLDAEFVVGSHVAEILSSRGIVEVLSVVDEPKKNND